MNVQKKNRLIAAGIVTTVLLLVVLVAVMIYQIVEICVLNERRKDLKEKIEDYEEQIQETEDLIDYYTYGDGLYKLIIEYGIID
ncbi:MAG: hypothetical protein LUD19_00520 [Clostridia bacterium]|nr:hypothetical protein [Clostridia bacterium]MCD8308308.1 hypothetical protein [Clostridia bacterium]